MRHSQGPPTGASVLRAQASPTGKERKQYGTLAEAAGFSPGQSPRDYGRQKDREGREKKDAPSRAKVRTDKAG